MADEGIIGTCLKILLQLKQRLGCFKKALFVNFVAICAKKVSETKGSICKLLNDIRKDATKTDRIRIFSLVRKATIYAKTAFKKDFNVPADPVGFAISV
jgi:hypothetical protein